MSPSKLEIPGDCGLENMISENLDPQLNKIQLQFQSWDKIQISLWGRIQVIKMVIAPKLSCIISMLTLSIPVYTFKSIDKMIRVYLGGLKLCRDFTFINLMTVIYLIH
jgi:hypothetical protein